MSRPTHKTVLRAEDGTYYDVFNSYEEAYEYVIHQMGDDPEPYMGGWMDNYGRSMWIEEL